MLRVWLLVIVGALVALRAAAPQKPTRGDSAAVATGAKLYAQCCQVCHGKAGRGDGPGAAGLNPKPRNFREPKQLKSKSDDDLFKVISKGGPALKLSSAMVGWGSVLKEPQIRQLIAYVRTLGDSGLAAAGSKPAAGGKGK